MTQLPLHRTRPRPLPPTTSEMRTLILKCKERQHREHKTEDMSQAMTTERERSTHVEAWAGGSGCTEATRSEIPGRRCPGGWRGRRAASAGRCRRRRGRRTRESCRGAQGRRRRGSRRTRSTERSTSRCLGRRARRSLRGGRRW